MVHRYFENVMFAVFSPLATTWDDAMGFGSLDSRMGDTCRTIELVYMTLSLLMERLLQYTLHQ